MARQKAGDVFGFPPIITQTKLAFVDIFFVVQFAEPMVAEPRVPIPLGKFVNQSNSGGALSPTLFAKVAAEP